MNTSSNFIKTRDNHRLFLKREKRKSLKRKKNRVKKKKMKQGEKQEDDMKRIRLK